MSLNIEGILPIHKPVGKTSFSLVSLLRRLTHVKKIGHTGTLDPFADGVMVLLIGQKYTRQSDTYLNKDKEYLATLHLGIKTDTYDVDGAILERSTHIPTIEEIESIILHFQGEQLQTPPMYSAKKIQGKKLYELARKGITVERVQAQVTMHTTLVSYLYPYLKIHVKCSKGTYIRSVAHDMGLLLGCGAHLNALTRVRNGEYTLENCCDGARLLDPDYDWKRFLETVNGFC
jgi:tRNA pseudouridine55 synthase